MSYSCQETVLNTFSLLPALRGFWPMSPVAAGGSAVDLSGHGKKLGYNGAPVYNLYNDVVPYVGFDGVFDYLSHVDDALYDISGTETYIDTSIRGLTLGGWFWFNSSGHQHFIGKWDPAGNQRGYKIQRNPVTDAIQFSTSNNGLAVYNVVSPVVVPLNAWQFIVGRFIPGSNISIFVNTTRTGATGPVSLFNTSVEFAIGRSGVLEEYLDGRASLCFLCAAALPDFILNDLFSISKPLFGVL